MADDERHGYCGRCGSPVHRGDRFCGTCGTAVLPPPQQPEQVIPRETAASHGTATGGRNRRFSAAVGLAAFAAVLLVGAGALTMAALGGGPALLGGGAPRPAATDEEPGAQGTGPADGRGSTAASGSPDAALERFVSDYYEAALDREDWAGTYSMLDDASRGRITEEEWARGQQALQDADPDYPPAPLEAATVDEVAEQGDAIRVDLTLAYEDGTEDSALIEVVRDEGGGYERRLTEEEVSYLEDAAQNAQGGAEEAAGEYYRAAGAGDWDYTYEHLDSETQSAFTREEWYQKNEWLSDNGPAVYDVLSVELDETSGEPLVAEVSVRITAEDGSSSFVRDTFFVLEDGEWLHRFGQEEYDSLMPGVPFEEFVAAQQ